MDSRGRASGMDTVPESLPPKGLPLIGRGVKGGNIFAIVFSIPMCD